MRLFTSLYNKVLAWAKHRYAVYYLAGLSFAECSFFPVPPDFMLAPMVLSKPDKAWSYALVTTITSTLGSAFGYLLGMFFFAMLEPMIHHLGYMPAYAQAQHWFGVWGVLAIVAVNFTPIPYKIFTIAAGAMSMAFVPFLVASTISRGIRFFAVASIMKWGGKSMQPIIERYVEWLGWLLIIILVALYWWFKR